MSNVRTVAVDEDMAKAIDRGSDVDVELKQLTSEDKGIKVKIAALAESAHTGRRN